MFTFRLEIIGLFGHASATPKKPRKYGLASGAVSMSGGISLGAYSGGMVVVFLITD